MGVLRQTSKSPVVRYQVLGLAIVAGWEGGYFFLEGFSPDGISHGRGSHAEIEVLQSELNTVETETSAFHPDNLLDSRQRIIASIVRRQGQKDFRDRLLKAYNYKCAVSRWDVIDILEAAHIVPYFGVQSNHISNGLLLRSDLHILFDLGKLAIDAAEMTVIISKALHNTPYMEYNGTKLHLPTSVEERPSTIALNHHREWAGL